MKKLNFLFLIIGLVAIGCSGETEQTEAPAEELVKTVNVNTEVVSPSTFTSYLRVVGTVETSNDITISSEVSGRVISINAQEGSKVRKGQTILTIDDSKLKQEKVRLEAMTAQAKDNFTRLEKVYKEDGIGSESAYLNAKYAYEQNNSALESIKIDLANTTIKAPFNGNIESINLEVGEMASQGAPMVRLIGSDEFIVSAGVPARYANVVKKGDEVDIWFDTALVDTLYAEVNFVGSSINPLNRTFKIEAALPKGIAYKVDMITNMQLVTSKRENVIQVSEEFVYSKKNGYVVYVFGKNESGQAVAEERSVKLGASFKTHVIVENGLSAGEELITIGSAFLNNGMRITVKNKDVQPIAAN